MSNNGYEPEKADDGSQVFIGFPMEAPSLEQAMPSPGSGGNPYYWWVVSFFYNAVYADLSVNQALDAASNQFMGGSFETTPLWNGFIPYWYNLPITNPDWLTSTMVVYGNGRLKLNCFGDDFQDGNYNGWTVNQGSWAVSGAKIVAQQGSSLIRTNNQFSDDRHVRAQVRTISSGANSWDTAWVIAKYGNMWQDMVYALIHTNGEVELAVYRNWESANGMLILV
jgi:hypothetical protein